MKSKIKFFLLIFISYTSVAAQSEEFGLASYYSDLFHGKPTASGELYDMNKLTAAHKTLPFGTIIKVTRIDNNKSIQLTVNDRGPFISGRVVEVSKEAAKQLDLIREGSASVRVEVVARGTSENTIATNKKDDKPKEYSDTETVAKNAPSAKTDEPAKKSEPSKSDKKVAKNSNEDKSLAKPTNKKEPQAKAVLVKGTDYQTFDLYQIELKRPEKKGFGVQVAAFTTQDALFKKIADLQGDWFSNILVSIEKGAKDETLYKVILGPFNDEPSAQSYKTSLKKNKKLDGFVVDLSALK